MGDQRDWPAHSVASTVSSLSPPRQDEQPEFSPGRRPGKQTIIQRTRTGCYTCRSRRIKCDEQTPACGPCRKARRLCTWVAPDDDRRQPRLPRRPNATACLPCKQKKLKCVGELASACERCRSLGLECVRAVRTIVRSSPEPEPSPSSAEPRPSIAATIEAAAPATGSAGRRPNDSATVRPAQLPESPELTDLVALYFQTVHSAYRSCGKEASKAHERAVADKIDFGYFSFVHELRFNRLLAKGKAPRELTLIMIANAVRFAAEPTPENLARADAWADAAIAAVLPRIYQGFGALQLMVLLLAQHYDFNRGNFSSAWLLAANCTRMMQLMSLQTFDRTYAAGLAPQLQLSPLLTYEALRRMAWSTFYADTMADGGRYGVHLIDEHAYRLQLPCDQAHFLSNEAVVTEPMFVEAGGQQQDIHTDGGGGNDSINNGTTTTTTTTTTIAAPSAIPGTAAALDLGAFLLRTTSARRRALHFAFRASHREETAEQLLAEMARLEADVEQVIVGLPARFAWNADNMVVHRDRLGMFLLLHVLRQNLYIVLGRAALLVYARCADGAQRMTPVRRNRIARALPIAGLIAAGFKAGVCFDPQFGVQAYVALEILLFEPRRLAKIDPMVDPRAPRLMEALPHLLRVIREIGLRSESVKQMHIEAVHRLLRCDCAHLLTPADFVAFHSEYAFVGQEAAEYDFRDFRWAKIERLRRGVRPAPGAHIGKASDGLLLEYAVDDEAEASAPASPRLDALDVTREINAAAALSAASLSPPSPSASVAPAAVAGIPSDLTLLDAGAPGVAGPPQGTSPPPTPLAPPAPAQPWWVATPTNADYEFSVDWSWFLNETGYPGHQTGDPSTFWNQLY
ncbi:Zn(2)-C6 fungal-type DNA-binding domain protein [Niveomyces insectorum RCEF 264]|uniref:Zn(2)-C6 fungal-type DNA-binding domain protein n=1 Tax=Niveomyces insectorum RCEF 264 TaxID=1081102 RepID=A0A167UWD4_9HYPO|nr:Zn(2)-C6 fungal-type DNA-binding domain protein [Niveomyces insectorum RCEF 264]